MKIAIAICLFSIVCLAQDSPKATVYVYRYKQFYGSKRSPSVYSDKKELARIQNGRYFVAVLPPGKHLISARDKESMVELTLEPGQTEYIRIDMEAYGHLLHMPGGQGKTEVGNLKYVDGGMIKDKQTVPGKAP